ncbi:hypothetical protein ABTN28_19225, partial [Acinetobacter baumannii]
PTMTDGLYVPLADGDLRLDPLTEAHRDGLRSACAADTEIWSSYSANYGPEAFDAQFDTLLNAAPARRAYAILYGAAVVGMTGWIARGDP